LPFLRERVRVRVSHLPLPFLRERVRVRVRVSSSPLALFKGKGQG